MANLSAHDILSLLGDSSRMGLHNDRLSRLVADTLNLARQEEELSDDDLDFVAAARKSETDGVMDLFDDGE